MLRKGGAEGGRDSSGASCFFVPADGKDAAASALQHRSLQGDQRGHSIVPIAGAQGEGLLPRPQVGV